MAGETEVGRLAVRVLPDTKRFNEDLKRKLDAIERRTKFNLRLDVDDKELSNLQRKIDKLGDRVKLKVDTSDLESKIREVQEKLDNAEMDIDGDTSKAKAAVKEFEKTLRDVEVDVDANTAKARASLAALQRDRKVNLKVDLDPGVLKRLATILGSLGTASLATTGIGALIAGIGALGTSLLGAIGPLASFLGSLGALKGTLLPLPGLMAGFAFGVGTLMLAMKDAGEQLKSLLPQLKAFQKSISGAFWKEAKKPILDMANKVLPVFRKEMTATAKELGKFTTQFAKVLESNLTAKNVAPMFKDLNESIKIASQALAPLVESMMTLGRVGSQYLPRLAQWFTDLANKANDFLSVNEKNGNLKKWAEEGIQALKDLGTVLGSTFSILGSIGKAAEAAGHMTLNSFAKSIKKAADYLKTPEIQKGMTTFFTSVNNAMDAIGKSIGRLLKQFMSMGTTLQPILNSMVGVVTRLVDGLTGAFADMGVQKGLVGFFGELERTVAALTPAFTPLLNILATAGTALLKLATALGPGLTILLQNLVPVFETLGESVGKFAEAFGPAFAGFIDALAPTFEQLGPFLSNVVDLFTAMLPLLKPIGELFNALLKPLLQMANEVMPVLLPVMQELFTALGQLFTELAPIIMKVMEALMPLITTIVTELLPPLLDIIIQLLPFIKMMADVFLWFVENVLVPMMPVIQGIVTAFGWLLEVISGFIGWVTEVINGFAAWWNEVWTGITTFFSDVWTGLGDFFKGLWEGLVATVTGVVTTITELIGGFLTGIQAVWNATWSAVGKFFSDIWNNIATVISTLINTVKTIINNGLTFIQDLWNNIWTAIKNFVSTIWNGIVNFVSGGVGKAKTTVSDGVNSIKDIWNKAWEAIKNSVSKAWEGIVSGVKQGAGNVISAVKSLVTSILDAFKELPAKLTEIGKQMISGLVGGIKSMAGSAIGAAKDVASGAIGAARGVLGIRSPSRVFKAIGEYVNKGFIQGIQGTKAETIRSMASVYKKLVSTGDSYAKQLAKANEAVAKAGGAQGKQLAKANEAAVARNEKLAQRMAKANKSLDKANAIKDPKKRKSAQVTARERIADLKKEQAKSKATTVARLKDLTKTQKASRDAALKRLNDLKKEYNYATPKSYERAAAMVKKYDDQLINNAATRDKIKAKIDLERKSLEGLKNGYDSLKSSVKSSMMNEWNLSDTFKMKAPMGAKGLAQYTNSIASRINAFASKLAKLKKMGIHPALIQEIAGLGSEKGMMIANGIISSSSTEVKALNKAYKSLENASTRAGFYVAQANFRAGIDAKQGLINGLTTDLKAVEKAGESLGKAVERGIRRVLKIHSPSRVTTELGKYTGDGFINGLDSRQRAAQSSMDSLTGVASGNVSGSSWSQTDMQMLAEILNSRPIQTSVQIGSREFAQAISETQTKMVNGKVANPFLQKG